MIELSEDEWMRQQLDPLIEFKSFGKIARLRRGMVITEKIDGTNAAIGSIKIGEGSKGHPDLDSPAVRLVTMGDGVVFAIYAQSRRRLISVHDDNYGFAEWVDQHAATLVRDLGPGLHYGEWWGQGVQRNYGQAHKIFSLFNVHKWEQKAPDFETPNMTTVPVVARCTFDTGVIQNALDTLRLGGSLAAPGFGFPEGVVVYHPAAGVLFKETLDADDQPKSLSQVRRLEAIADAA